MFGPPCDPRNPTLAQDVFYSKKKRWSVQWSAQICTLRPLRFIFSLVQTVCPNIPSFAHFEDCCCTNNFF